MSQLRPFDGKRLISVFVATLALLSSVRALPSTDPPLRAGQHIMFMWNAPTELCDSRYDMPLDLSLFQYISSTLKSAVNQRIALFYTDRFGLFPHVDEDTGELFDEGLPQLIDLEEHHELAEDDIEFYITGNRPGLAVLDFEEWRPQWVRNWGSKDIYRQLSIEKVQEKNPSMTEDEVEDRAKVVFERGARKYFLKSIRIGKTLRPNRLWGFYLFPDCYNYGYHKDMEGFTGECPEIEQDRNDNLMWLWKESTALFPSIYLELVLRDSQQARMYVRHRIREAMRVSMLPNSSYSIPIYPYIRPVYKDAKDDYMSEFDLVNTIGEAVALGAAGIISWGDMDVTDSEESCFDAQDHLKQVMNPYILNVSTAARLCSEELCGGRGRCVRRRWNEDVYLHLDPRRYSIVRPKPDAPLTVKGSVSQDDVDYFDRNFDCICYSEKQCHSLLMFDDVHEAAVVDAPKAVVDAPEAVVDQTTGGAQRPRPPHQLETILLRLKYVVMSI